MQNIILNIKNSELEDYIIKSSKAKKKSVETFICEILEQYFFNKVKNENTEIPINLYHKLIKQSEKDFEEGKIKEHSEFEKETNLW